MEVEHCAYCKVKLHPALTAAGNTAVHEGKRAALCSDCKAHESALVIEYAHGKLEIAEFAAEIREQVQRKADLRYQHRTVTVDYAYAVHKLSYDSYKPTYEQWLETCYTETVKTKEQLENKVDAT